MSRAAIFGPFGCRFLFPLALLPIDTFGYRDTWHELRKEPIMFLITNKGFNPAVGLGLCALWLPFAQTAQAGCGDVPWNVGVINAQWAVYTAAPFANRLTMVAREYGDQPQPSGAGIVGMW